MNKKNKFDITDIGLKFMMEEPLLGYLFSQLKIKETKEIDTAAVYFDNKELKYVLLYNPFFMEKLLEKQQIAIIKHELYHIMFKHLLRHNIKKFKKILAVNIAMDMSINQYIDNLPVGAVYPETYNLPQGLNWEEYYFKIKNLFSDDKKNTDDNKADKGKNTNTGDTDIDNNDENNNDNSGQNIKEHKNEKTTSGNNDEDNKNLTSENEDNEDTNEGNSKIPKTLDNHIFMDNKQNFNEDNNADIDKEIQEVYTNNLLKQVYEEHKKREKQFNKSFSISGINKLKEILKINKNPPKLDVRKLLKNFIEKEILTNTKYDTWFRPNRRFINQKGKKKEKVKKLLIAIDTSYSISFESIQNFINEIYHYFDNLEDYIEIVLFHSDIYMIIKDLNKKNRQKLKKIQSGGTDFQKVFDYAKKSDFSYMIMLTDGLGNKKLHTYGIKAVFVDENLKNIKILKRTKIVDASNIFNLK